MITVLKTRIKRFKSLLSVFISISFVMLLLIFPQNVRSGAESGLRSCAEIILISVFPFSVAAKLLSSSGFLDAAGRAVGKPLRKIFGVSSRGFGIVLLGSFGGYPSGAAACADLYASKCIDKDEAERIISYSNNASPAFTVSFISACCGSTISGFVCFFIILLSAAVWALMIRKKKTITYDYDISGANDISFIKAVTASACSTLNICAFVIIFSVISSLLNALINNDFISFIAPLLELISGVNIISNMNIDERLFLALTSSYISFSGLCVFAQIRSEAGRVGLSVRYYLPGKLFQAVFSFIAVYLLYPIIFSL